MAPHEIFQGISFRRVMTVNVIRLQKYVDRAVNVWITAKVETGIINIV